MINKQLTISDSDSSFAYPDGDALVDQWKARMSLGLKESLRVVLSKSREKGVELLNIETARLLAMEDSEQKVFDLYGVSQFFGLLKELGRRKEVLIVLSRMAPYAEIDKEIAAICMQRGDLLERFEYLKKAHEKMPECPEILSLFGSSMFDLGKAEEGIKLLEQAVREMPNHAYAYSNYLFYCHHATELDCQKIFDEHKEWARINADKDFMTDHKNDADPERKLRIGYISPDFYMHPVGVLLEAIIESRDKDTLEVFGYSNVLIEDDLTKSFQEEFDHFRSVRGIDSSKVSDMILEDKIDILVDLAGHTCDNRLDVMAYKPAPVQATYLGYFDTTGMEQVDYFLTDAQMSPPESKKCHTEELMYFPETCFCYNSPKTSSRLDVLESPAITNGYVTFGMFSNPAKINPGILRLWAKVLRAIPTSRLKMIMNEGDNDEVRDIYLKKFLDVGVSSDRIDIRGKSGYADYLNEYNKVDIVFDTFPYCGGATTCDAFWMGVPVVSLVGEHHFSRVGLSLLSAVGLGFLAAKNEEEYAAKATVLASKPETLNKIRFQLRQRMMASDMCNPKRQARNMENAYREMWRKWCWQKQCEITV